MLRVVFAGTPDFATTALEAIHHSGHQIVLVMTQPDRPAGRGLQLQASSVKKYAQEHNLPVIQPTSLKLDGKYPQEAKQALDLLAKTEFDVMVVAAYGLLLPQEVFHLAEQNGRAGCINIHASVLPRWRGAAPIHRAIEHGDSMTGISIMQMDLGLDTGAVIAKEEIKIRALDTTDILHDRLAKLGGEMIVKVLHQFESNGPLSSTPQPLDGITYAHKVSKEEAKLDWSLSAEELDCKIRAFNPFPGTSFEKDGLVIKAWFSEVNPTFTVPKFNKPGEIIQIDKSGVYVATGRGFLLLRELQKPGGKKQPAYQVAQSLQWKAGQEVS